MVDACVFRLMEDGRITIIVVHVDCIFAVGKDRCDHFGRDLTESSCEKSWGIAVFLGMSLRKKNGRGRRRRFISRPMLAEEYGVKEGKSIPLPAGGMTSRFRRE